MKKFKFWLWIFQFKLNRVKDSERIAFLAKELLKEVEAQGYNLKSTDAIYSADIKIYEFDKSHRLTVSNSLSGWEVNCGAYQPKVEVEDK